MKLHRTLVVLATAVALAGCATGEKEPLRITPKNEIATSPVVREILPQPVPPIAAPAPAELAPAAPQLPAPATNPEASSGTAPTLAIAAPGSGPPATPGGPPTVAIPKPIPPGTLYVCTATVNGAIQQTAIEYEPRVKQLCSKHPEMSVCQYEREACRASGGRVYTTAGVEITKQTEAEYDKKVMRVRFRAG